MLIKGGFYAGDDHETGYSALRHDIHGMYRRTGNAGNKSYLQKNDPKYTAITESQGKMAESVEVQRQALAQDEPFCMVSISGLYLSPGTVGFS